MISTQNDFIAYTQKNLYHFKNPQLLAPQDSDRNKTFNPQAHPLLDGESRSFIVAWQLPKMVNCDANQP